jgi:hypothetical protein
MVMMSASALRATDYYVNSATGNDANAGTSADLSFKSISKVNGLALKAGDRVLFAAGQCFVGELRLIGLQGSPLQPIVIDRYPAGGSNFIIDAKGEPNGVLMQDCHFLVLKHATVDADGFPADQISDVSMRVGVMVRVSAGKVSKNIVLDSLEIKNIYFENKGYTRGADEVKTANGTQKYGWGIRLMTEHASAQITQVDISHCKIRDVDHTGIKLTGAGRNIHWVRIYNNVVAHTGGPGIQMSEVKNVHVHHNSVDHSGSNTDSRKWGRGSGLWTWGSSNVLIEHNSFTNANGPGDSAGAHIDYNCDHVVLQYNFSANNAGGFCEILGNNYNCAYRYNVSVNDGHRIKGQNGAFQEGKTFWLSGYQGDKQRKGPVNSYFYNNTIYLDSSIVSRVAIDATSRGILIANNIFCILGVSKTVMGDQYKPDNGSTTVEGAVMFKNNLWYSPKAWPADALIKDSKPVIGDPKFKKPGGQNIGDYAPLNKNLVKGKGIRIEQLQGDFLGLLRGMNPDKDILGRPIGQAPPMGAISPE